jgi:hypothetical protein
MLDRQEFHALMTAALGAPRGADAAGGLVDPGRVKSRLVEAHPPEGSPDGVATLIGHVAEVEGLRADLIGDELWKLEDGSARTFVDTLNPRFWQIHSTSSSSSVARLLKRITTRFTQLDSAWLPSGQLQQLEGRRLWIKSTFNGDTLLGSEAPERRWRARFEGEAPDELLHLLADTRYARATALAGVGSIVEEPGIGRAHVVADFRGSFVFGAGGDFEVGASVLWNVVRRYEALIRSLEDRHQLKLEYGEHGGFAIDGDVALIEFPERVDPQLLVEGLFTTKEPFRLWAVPKQIAEEEWEANAVDLHVGQPLRLEISPYRVRLLLDEDTCGNTLARMLTNLQRHLDARSRLALAA